MKKIIEFDKDKSIVFFPETLQIGLIDKKLSTTDCADSYISNSDTPVDIRNDYKNIYKLMVNLTDNCNLKCKYCYSNYEDINDLDTKLTEVIISKFFLNKSCISVDNIFFFGGEPLLNYNTLVYFVNRINELHNDGKIAFSPKFHIITNGTIFNEKIGRFFYENNIDVIVSIDGPKYIQDYQRPFKNSDHSSFDIIVPNILSMKSFDLKISYEATFTNFSRENCSKIKLRKFFHESLELNSGIIVDEMIENRNDIGYIDFIDKDENCFINALHNIDLNDEHFEYSYRLLLKKKINYPCTLGKDTFHILANGDIYPCQILSGNKKFLIGNVLHSDFDNILDNNFFKMLNKEYDNDKCKKCYIRHICKYCPARNYIEYKNWHLSEEQCEILKKKIEELIIEIVYLRKDKGKYDFFKQKLRDKLRQANLRSSL